VWEWECPSCETDNETDFPWGDPVTCAGCDKTYETDYEESWDSYDCTLAGEVKTTPEPTQQKETTE